LCFENEKIFENFSLKHVIGLKEDILKAFSKLEAFQAIFEEKKLRFCFVSLNFQTKSHGKKIKQNFQKKNSIKKSSKSHFHHHPQNPVTENISHSSRERLIGFSFRVFFKVSNYQPGIDRTFQSISSPQWFSFEN